MPKRLEKVLTAKESAFCREYVIDWNATRAAIAAGYSKRSAREIGYENLTKPHIKAMVEQLIKNKIMKQEEVLARLADMARGSHYPFIEVDSDGFAYFNFSDSEAKKHFHLIKKIKTKRKRFVYGKGDDAEEWEGEWVEVELHDAQKALELLGKHLRLFQETNLNIDLSKLTDAQLERIVNGEDPLKVIVNA